VSQVVDRPPEELAAGAISLVRYRGGETRDLVRAVNESLDHLRPWMPWAATHRAENDLDDFVRRSIKQWECGSNFSYWMRDEATGHLVGSVGLHLRVGPEAVEIGYWVHVDWTSRGYATAAARALTTAGLGMRAIKRVEIHCDEANRASAAVPRRLGYRLDRIEDDQIEAPGEVGREMVWIMNGESWSPQ
jgi:RimJ/RimL family protein N-acetyltransferase